MTVESDIAVIETIAETERSSYVDWPAIIAGIVLASALSVLFLTFGAAVGLSFTNFNARPDVSPIWLGIAAASWLLWVQISSFMAGGYLTGRLRKRHENATEDEVDVRDGAHGLLVWAGALVIGAILAVGGVGATVSAVGSAVATVTEAAGDAVGDAVDPNAYFVDALYRAPAQAAGAAAPPATTPGASAADLEALRAETSRIFARGALAGGVPGEDRIYLAQLVAANTSLTEEEATARVDQVTTAMETAAAEAAEVAETARKMAVIAAFLTAASLLVSAVGAWWAAQMGGNHRDSNVVFPGAFRRL